MRRMQRSFLCLHHGPLCYEDRLIWVNWYMSGKIESLKQVASNSHQRLVSEAGTIYFKSKNKKVGVLPIRIEKSNASSIGHSSERSKK